MARLSRTQRQELWQDRLERYSRGDLTVARKPESIHFDGRKVSRASVTPTP